MATAEGSRMVYKPKNSREEFFVFVDTNQVKLND